MDTEKNALLSVYDKTGIVEFAQDLVALGWNIISSGGTASVLREAQIQVTDVAELTGLPAVLGHRVVTLAPQIHGGLLATEAQEEELRQLGWPWIDLACVDLYPLKEETRREGATQASVIEMTDIGGPTMIRSAAKGRRIVIADPGDRARVIEWLKKGQPNGVEFRNALAAKAEAIIAAYCLESACFHGIYDGMIGTKVSDCKYGENPYQTPAGLFTRDTDDVLALPRFELVGGSSPSFNNWGDIDRLLQTATHIAAVFEQNNRVPYIAVGVKHGNPCGAAVDINAGDVLRSMIEGDPLALFGGFVMTNFPILQEEATILRQWGMKEGSSRIIDGVLAPFFSEEGKAELDRRRGKCRMLQNPALADLSRSSLDTTMRLLPVRGGFLMQPNYTYVLDFQDPDLEIVGDRCTEIIERYLRLAWGIGCTTNSNTVVLVNNGKLIGLGGGQQDRVGAATLAVARARRSGHGITDAVAYSDSFFPYPDGVQVLIDAGVQAIFASSGSINDEATRETCRKAGVTLYLLPDKKCRGFFGH